MEDDKIRQKARKLINEKYPYLPFKEWGYFEDMFINGWKQALTIPVVVWRSEQLKAFADYAQKRVWEDGDKDLSEFVDEFLRL